MSDSKVTFAASYDEIMENQGTTGTPEACEALVKFGPGMAINIRAVHLQRDGSIRPNCWLHKINEDGSTTPICFLPLVPSTYSRMYGGHNHTWFMRTWKDVWTDLEKRARESIRQDGSEAVASVDDNEAAPY